MTASRVLGITTSAIPEIALLRGKRVVAAAGDGQALESLVPVMERVFAEAQSGVHEVELIAVCVGPGSFTGLRIGVAFAKSLAQSRDISIIGISAYDVAAFDNQRYPVIALVTGKADFYYARLSRSVDGAAEFISGDRVSIERIAARVGSDLGTMPLMLGNDFSSYTTGERARRIALLGQRAHAAGLTASWRDIAIDYGQRPNAVINWERRQAQAQEGQPFERRESRTGEGPASPA